MDEPQDWTCVSYEEARATLKKWREEHARRSEEVVEIWEYVLSRYSSTLKDELWAVLEQVAIAAIDQARSDLAIYCLQMLNKQFPNSMRVTRLQAMRLEAVNDWRGAEHLYDTLIEADEANPFYRKRKIAILLAKGERQEAIYALNKFLKTFINDTEAWLQLSLLFVAESDFSRAAFCFEEVILSNPHNPTFLTKMAEIRYSQGGQENVEIARIYYEKSIILVPTASALYGLIFCYNQLASSAAAQRKKELLAAGTRACDRLALLYQEKLESMSCSSLVEENGNGTNPTIGRQLAVIHLLKEQFKD